jgi:hypothetical protein
MHYDENYIREHWVIECGWLSKEMIAVLDALFAHGPLKKLPKGWVGRNGVLSAQAAKGLIRRGLAEIKGKHPHERLCATEEPRLRFEALHLNTKTI